MKLSDLLPINESRIIAILGRRGQGKTTLLRSIMALARRQGRFLWVVDPEYQLHPRRPWGAMEIMNNIKDLPEPRRLGKRSIVLLDEVDRWGRDQRLLDLVNYCRPWGVSVAWTARRPARVPRDITALADYLVLFRVTEPRDLAYIREYSEEAYRAAPSLQPFHPIIISLS